MVILNLYSNLTAGFAVGSAFAYPFYYVKDLMELSPKERGGHCSFDGSYYNAVRWILSNYEHHITNSLDGYWYWFRTKGIIFYLVDFNNKRHAGKLTILECSKIS